MSAFLRQQEVVKRWPMCCQLLRYEMINLLEIRLLTVEAIPSHFLRELSLVFVL
jgi:hypothetical protein